MFYIKTKDTSFLGYSHGLKFIDGVAQTDDEYLAERMKSKGYIVEKISEEESGPHKKGKK